MLWLQHIELFPFVAKNRPGSVNRTRKFHGKSHGTDIFLEKFSEIPQLLCYRCDPFKRNTRERNKTTLKFSMKSFQIWVIPLGVSSFWRKISERLRKFSVPFAWGNFRHSISFLSRFFLVSSSLSPYILSLRINDELTSLDTNT